jgi:hypothetical protein
LPTVTGTLALTGRTCGAMAGASATGMNWVFVAVCVPPPNCREAAVLAAVAPA